MAFSEYMNFKTSHQMLPNHPDGEFEILKMFQDILPDIEKVPGHFIPRLFNPGLFNYELFNHES